MIFLINKQRLSRKNNLHIQVFYRNIKTNLFKLKNINSEIFKMKKIYIETITVYSKEICTKLKFGMFSRCSTVVSSKF